MSQDSDSFIREVSEEVRRDRAFGLWKRFGPFVIIGLVAVILVAAGDAFWSARQRSAAREAGGKLLVAGSQVDAAARARALETAAADMSEGPAAVARIAGAGALAEAGDLAGAARLYDQAVLDGGLNPALEEFAVLRAAMARIEVEGPEAASVALAPLTEEGRPFRLLALEALGVAKLKSGDAAGAIQAFDRALSDPAATEGLTARLEQFKAAARGVGDG